VANTREASTVLLNDFSASGRIELVRRSANADIGPPPTARSISAPQVTEIAYSQARPSTMYCNPSTASEPPHGRWKRHALRRRRQDLSGQRGDDHLDGGAGKTHVFNQGDGIDTITDELALTTRASSSWPRHHPWQIRSVLLLVLNYGASDAIHFSAFDPDDPTQPRHSAPRVPRRKLAVVPASARADFSSSAAR
jgi:hypothetical protein